MVCPLPSLSISLSVIPFGGAFSPSLHMNTKQARVVEGTKDRERERERERESQSGRGHTRSDGISSRGYSVVSRFPGTRARDPGQGTHDQYGVTWRNSYNDTSFGDHRRPPSVLSPCHDEDERSNSLFPRTCARIITYTCALF